MNISIQESFEIKENNENCANYDRVSTGREYWTSTYYSVDAVQTKIGRSLDKKFSSEICEKLLWGPRNDSGQLSVKYLGGTASLDLVFEDFVYFLKK